MRRAVALGVALAALATAVVTLPAGASSHDNPPFWVVGTVAEVSPTGFVVDPVTDASDTAASHVQDGALTIRVAPYTGYFKKDDTGAYRRSTYDETVQVGDQIRTFGRRATGASGVAQFFATYVWNPPNSPSPGDGPTTPDCYGDASIVDQDFDPVLNLQNGIKNAGFNIKGTVVAKRAQVPCTGIGGVLGGMQIDNLTDPTSVRADVAEGIEAYGGRPHVYTSQATQFFEGGVRSDYNRVVRSGNDVRVLGRYQRANHGWLFVARIVWTPPPVGPSDTKNDRVVINAVQDGSGADGSTHYAGPTGTTSTAFGPPHGRFEADIVWTATPEGDFTATGTWVLTNQQEVLRGTLDGATAGTAIDLSIEVTSGEGTIHAGARGSGDFEGSVSPGTPTAPSGFSGTMRISLVLPS